MAHTCHATDCHRVVPPAMFACRDHWRALPDAMQRRIWQTYRPGQEEDWRPSKEYLLAARDAVTFLAKKEGRAADTRLYDWWLRTQREEASA